MGGAAPSRIRSTWPSSGFTPNIEPTGAPSSARPLEAGMVISIETAIHHPRRGFIKLEDTVAVTPDGCEGFGDHGRGWNRGGTAIRS